MVELNILYASLYASVAVPAGLVAIMAWRRQSARGARAIAYMLFGVAIWSGAYAMMWSATSFESQLFWERMTSLGSWMVPVGFLALAFDVAGMDRWRSRRRMTAIAVVGFVLSNLDWVNPGGLYATGIESTRIGSYTHFSPVWGPLLWVFVAYAYALVLVAYVILGRVFFRSSGAARSEAALLLFGGLIPSIASVITQSGFVPLHVDLAPIAFMATGSLWLIAILRGTLLDVLPLARDTLVEQMADGVVVFDGADLAVDVNPAALSMLRTPQAEVLGMAAEGVLRVVRGATDMLGGGASRAVLPIGPDAESRYVDLGITPLFAGLGQPPAQLVTLHDVTEDRRAAVRLTLFHRIFDTANEGIIVTLPDATIVDVNQAFATMHGMTREELLGQNPRVLKSDRHNPEFYRHLWRTLLETDVWTGEIWDRRTDGEVFPKLLSIAAVKDEHGETAHYVGICSDITEIKTAENNLMHLATHDPLTDLPNRTLLDDRLSTALARGKRMEGSAALFYFDIDRFKEVNDQFGHSAGDALLVEIAERCLATLRESDTLGRIGGDEFNIIVSDFSSVEHLSHLAARLLATIGQPVLIGDQEVSVTASIGIAIFPTHGTQEAELVRHADAAMYRAKELGRNRFEFFS